MWERQLVLASAGRRESYQKATVEPVYLSLPSFFYPHEDDQRQQQKKSGSCLQNEIGIGLIDEKRSLLEVDYLRYICILLLCVSCYFPLFIGYIQNTTTTVHLALAIY